MRSRAAGFGGRTFFNDKKRAAGSTVEAIKRCESS
jgi:hypothetical protein